MPEAARVDINLPPVLLRLFPGCPRRVELAAATVGEAIDRLDARWPGLRDRLCDSTPRIRRYVNVFVAGERVSLATALSPGTEIIVMTSVSGG